ncbi:Lipoyl synthase, mitochondrial (Lipoate synthase) (LS) (Lip-syn) (Lipoic acid synthase) [Mucor velutinosus]|uniref:Lipoyl synthase, mitochondrial (Lipoate synthase) (LS) (Lip-syn) (Lipoic acid synthase) n=1 Tax=Mucor velutinosus TaxID=708070 RepID=A0AAN7I205_9FUNG|nr:Lipoyl synthase, mitochondrial (Lipoate synthase) (LS) (Lip-syn) (Lipoic acid synthase) [Mucor velutinosus]
MNRQPQYIVVNGGKKKKAVAVAPLPKKSNMDMDKEEDVWPTSLKEYVANAFSNCLPNMKTTLETQLKAIIKQAKNTNMMDVIDWNSRDLPSACITTNNPNGVDLFHKQAKIGTKKTASTIGNIELTPAEERKRQLRAMRFQNDVPATPATVEPARKKKKAFTPIVWGNEAEADMNDVIVGTSTELEKPYFRLTSAADPATVRPLNILKKAFKMLRQKWREDGNYSYICEQLKSMRQDLTVQRIRTEFTVRVYETHARIALEKGDIGEYNQCQTQLKYLYEQNIPGCEDEFLAYRILYMLFSQNQSDINAMLEEMCDVGLQNHAECVRHALMVRSALAKGNYHKFFRLYETAPNMGGYLLDQFVGRKRIDALIVICKVYKMGISLAYVAKELSFDSVKKLAKFLREHGIKQLASKSKDAMLDTRTALPVLMAQSKNYNKVDIKGQI